MEFERSGTSICSCICGQIIIWWLIFEKKTISILPGNLNSGLSYLIATVCNVKDSTHGLTNSQFSWILNFHESFLDKLYYFQTTSILKIDHKLFVKTNFLTRSTSGPPHILSSLQNNEMDFFFLNIFKINVLTAKCQSLVF